MQVATAPKPNIRAALFHCPECKYTDVAPPDSSLKICLRCGFYEKTNLETGEKGKLDKAVDWFLWLFVGGLGTWILYNL